MQFTSDGAPPRGRTQTTYSELVREVSGDPAPADRVLGRSSSDDDLSSIIQSTRMSSHEQHLDDVDLLRLNALKNGASHSNPDVTRETAISPQPLVTDDPASPPPLPVRNKPLSTSGSHDGDPFDQADPFESGRDVSDPSDFYQTPRNTMMVANGDSSSVSEGQQQSPSEGAAVNRPPAVERVTKASTTSTVASGYEESSLWINVDDELEYQSPVIPYHDQHGTSTKVNPYNQDDDAAAAAGRDNPNDQHDDHPNDNPNDQRHHDDDDDEGEEYINPEVFGNRDNSDLRTIKEITIHDNDTTPSNTMATTTSSGDEYSFPAELLGVFPATPPRTTETATPPRTTETATPPRTTETATPPRTTETAMPPRTNEIAIPSKANEIPRPPRANETMLPPRGLSSNNNDQQQMLLSRPLPRLPHTAYPSHVAKQHSVEPPLPARTSCFAKGNSLTRTLTAPRQQPRYDREGWIMKYVQQGYSRDQVVRALAITQNDFNMASNILKEFVKM